MGKRARRKGVGPEEAAAAEPSNGAAEEPSAEPVAVDGDAAAAGEKGERQRAGGPGSLYDPRMREVIAYAEEADMLYHLFRWTLLKGGVPAARDWLTREDMPHPDAVAEVFGSWQKFLDYSGLPDSPLLARLRALEERERGIEAREQQVEREQQRAGDLRRQLDTARRKRDEAEAERDDEARRAQQAERALSAAEARATQAEASLHERREVAETTASAAREDASEDWLAAHEAALAELEAVRAHRDELTRRVAELEEAAERDRQAIAELSAALGERPAAEDEAAAAEEEAPKSVLEAVRVAAQTCPNLVFTESAFDSAADSPYRRPEEILDALRKLDALAERYNAGQMGVSLGQAAQEAGLSWRAGVSELARTRWAKHYVVTHDGVNLDLGPHLALGSGSGAGFVARVYLHLADGNGGVPRGIYVGHVGRHLPDTTT
jgi:chemotaxis protein histidine kinase CheA